MQLHPPVLGGVLRNRPKLMVCMWTVSRECEGVWGLRTEQKEKLGWDAVAGKKVWTDPVGALVLGWPFQGVWFWWLCPCTGQWLDGSCTCRRRMTLGRVPLFYLRLWDLRANPPPTLVDAGGHPTPPLLGGARSQFLYPKQSCSYTGSGRRNTCLSVVRRVIILV